MIHSTHSASNPGRAMKNIRQIGLLLAVGATLGGCATSGNPKDPLEGFNRAVFTFNDKLDEVALKPAATAYKNVLPTFAQTGVHNFFGNLSDVWSSANNLLQGKGDAGMTDFMRVALNSTFGIFGLLDIASEAGIPKHHEDFGQTLGFWGVGSGPYVVLPLLGPSTLRDTAALPVDSYGNVWSYKEPVYLRNIGTGIRIIDTRASLLDATSLLEGAALDRYQFVRDGYLQQRENRVHDGDGPRRGKPEADASATPPAADLGEPVSTDTSAQELTLDTPAENNASL